MNRYIHLRDLDHIELLPGRVDYRHESIAAARAAQVKRDLRFDNKTGVTYDSGGWIARYSNPSEFEPYKTIDDVLQCEFRGHIRNGASRIERGFEP